MDTFATIGLAAMLATGAPPAAEPAAEPSLAQYYGDPDWERRQYWRARRQAEEQARIEEAARREAWRIEQERRARRHARREWREQQGYGPPGFYRQW